ncbi:putative secreted protein [Propionispora sp. 2/2-37]|uniref:hypothetical protein n=1 Tax=Propionispora sp. 2/2-37 TaxID=1677858 RepID=UPI0006BB87C0|nr:hypothetical protein [Propionispora sp. 2/2-37]CUH95255.1 putative secreted protein [Propionispora sp. 2/2-37]
MSKSNFKKKIKCGTINPNTLKVAGKPNRAMTPEVKLAPIWADRKNDYKRHKEKQKIRRYSDDYGNGGFYLRTQFSYYHIR